MTNTREVKTLSHDFKSGRPVSILMPNMGAKGMPDFEDLKAKIRDMGANVIEADFSKKGSMQSIPWDQIDVIDLSNMRGCLTSFDKYTGILDRLYDRIEEQSAQGRSIGVIPEYQDVMWLSSKASYLPELESKGVPIIPTTVLCRLQNPENASIIAQPDNFDEMFDKMNDVMKNSDKTRFVLKPSTSSLGRGLFFIDCDQDSDALTLSIPLEENRMHAAEFESFDDLKSYLVSYFTNTPSHDHSFLFQEYVENLETSVVFVNGSPHFVERAQGDESHIAHARYGGTDRVIDNPEPELVSTAYGVLEALPESIQNSHYLRVDVMKDLETGGYILGELEGAGATRLWLREANRIEDYAQMLIDEGSKQQKLSPSYKIPAPEQDRDDPDIQESREVS